MLMKKMIILDIAGKIHESLQKKQGSLRLETLIFYSC